MCFLNLIEETLTDKKVGFTLISCLNTFLFPGFAQQQSISNANAFQVNPEVSKKERGFAFDVVLLCRSPA